ncbi:hypothetical protein Tco_0577776 [Tanacetum coccineum]
MLQRRRQTHTCSCKSMNKTCDCSVILLEKAEDQDLQRRQNHICLVKSTNKTHVIAQLLHSSKLKFIQMLGEDISKLILSGKEVTGLFEIAITLVLSQNIDSSDESVGSSPSRIILFGIILAEIHVKTPTILPVVPTLPHVLPFLCTDSLKIPSGSSERPPSQDPYEVTVARWRSIVTARSLLPSSPTQDLPPTLSQILPAPPGLPCRPAVLILPGHAIPLSRPYRTQPNGVHKMLTARKKVRALPVGRLTLRYPPDHSSLNHFSSDDSSSDDSSSDSSSDSLSDYSSDSSSGHSLPDSSFDAPATISA